MRKDLATEKICDFGDTNTVNLTFYLFLSKLFNNDWFFSIYLVVMVKKITIFNIANIMPEIENP